MKEVIAAKADKLKTIEAPEPSVASMIQAAIDKGVDPAGLEKLVDLYERLDARRAAREYAAALLGFQNACPVIMKNRRVKADKFGYHYATLDHIAITIRPHLDRFGLSWSADSAINDASVTATITVRHTGGHSERVTFTAPIDRNATMNEPQKVASALNYARRYGLIMALGLTTGEDDDGNAAGSQLISDSQAADIECLIGESGVDQTKFLAWMGVDQVAHIPARDYGKALRALQRKKTGGAR